MVLARFRLFERVRAGEGARVTAFTIHAFLMLVAYYLLKTMREPILLRGGSAELKSYACAAIALVMLLLLPIYGVAFRRLDPPRLLRWMTGLFAVGLTMFSIAGRSGMDVGFCYYVWVGVFGILILTQLWAHAAHVFGVERGQRVFPVVMVGAVLGGLAGPILFGACSRKLEPWDVMLLASAILLASLPFTTSMLPFPRRDAEQPAPPGTGRVVAGLANVMQDRYLLLLAGMAVLLNCVNTTGEYMLADFVVRYAEQKATTGSGLDAQALIGSFYADYYLSINALTTVFQVAVVGKLLRWIGISGALFVLPVISLVGYGLIGLVPGFAIIRAIKVLENSIDYSLMNTARHALYLPLPFDKKFEGKVAVDAVFYRVGDLVQAAVVFAGLRWLGFELRDFALLNMGLALIWVFVAVHLARGYARRVQPGHRVNWRVLSSHRRRVADCGGAARRETGLLQMPTLTVRPTMRAGFR
jgi:ATP:ADP antiporter, AAA family